MDISSEVGSTRYESNKAAESLVPMMLSPSVCTMWILRKDSARSSERLGRVSGRTQQGLRKDSARSSEGLGMVFGRTRQGLRKDSARSSEGLGTEVTLTRNTTDNNTIAILLCCSQRNPKYTVLRSSVVSKERICQF